MPDLPRVAAFHVSLPATCRCVPRVVLPPPCLCEPTHSNQLCACCCLQEAMLSLDRNRTDESLMAELTSSEQQQQQQQQDAQAPPAGVEQVRPRSTRTHTCSRQRVRASASSEPFAARRANERHCNQHNHPLPPCASRTGWARAGREPGPDGAELLPEPAKVSGRRDGANWCVHATNALRSCLLLPHVACAAC